MLESYSQEDTQQILQRAIALKQDDHFSPTQLQEMASEVGVSPQLLQKAEQEWLSQKAELQQKQQRRSRQRLAFRAHLIPYIAVNTFLVLLNLTTTPQHLWSVYPLLGWGLGVTLHGAAIQNGTTKGAAWMCDRKS